MLELTFKGIARGEASDTVRSCRGRSMWTPTIAGCPLLQAGKRIPAGREKELGIMPGVFLWSQSGTLGCGEDYIVDGERLYHHSCCRGGGGGGGKEILTAAKNEDPFISSSIGMCC